MTAGNEAGYDVTVASDSGCPFIDVQFVGRYGGAACDSFVSQSLRWLATHPANLVVLGNRDDMYIESTANGVIGPDGEATFDTGAKQQLWKQGLTRTLRTLSSRGTAVVLIRPVPSVRVPPGDCAVIRVLTRTCSRSVSREDVDTELRLTDQAEGLAVSRTPRTHLISFEDQLCSETRCPTIRGKTVIYRDTNHLTAEEARRFTPTFAHEFKSLQPETG